MTTRPDLSIILVNWNALTLTSDALSSLRDKTNGIKYEVFVVDNGTTRDASVRELPTRFPWITFIVNSSNEGFTKANNLAIRRATGRYVLLLNNDTVQTGNAPGESVLYMDTHPDVGALGILHLNNDAENTPQSSHFLFPDPWRDAAGLVGFRVRAAPTSLVINTPVEANVDWICGSFLLMRRECLEQVGELDERFFTYEEDVDWCFRARQAGWIVRFWSGTSMIHVGSAALPFMKDKTFVIFRSQLSYYFKHHGSLAAAAYYLAMGIRLVRALAWQGVRWMLGKGNSTDMHQRFNRLVQFAGLRSGRLGG